MSPRFLPLSTALVCALGLAVSTARAQVASADDSDAAANAARSQYNAGTKAFADQRYAEAALAFEAAADAKPSPVALFTAALSWDHTNAPDRAADDYARSLALGGLPSDKAAQAKDRLSVLEGTLGAVTVSGADGVRVQIDANSERPVPATLHGAAGVHTLTVRAPGGGIERRSVVLERGKTTMLDLATAPPAPAPDAHAPPAPAPRTFARTVGAPRPCRLANAGRHRGDGRRGRYAPGRGVARLPGERCEERVCRGAGARDVQSCVGAGRRGPTWRSSRGASSRRPAWRSSSGPRSARPSRRMPRSRCFPVAFS